MGMILKSKMIHPSILQHSVGVAEFMADYIRTRHPDKDPYPYYVLGLLHDIGKLYPGDPTTGNNRYKGHARKGGELMKDMGFVYWKEIAHHGHPEDAYWSSLLMLLNLADLSVNGKGEIIPIASRIADIGRRYGEDSEEYHNARRIREQLEKAGFIDTEGNIL